MLKLTYTENGFHLEYIAECLETWLTKRVLLALRTGTKLGIEPSAAAFLLPMDIPYLEELETVVDAENPLAIDLCDCDGDTIEVCLQGTWLNFENEDEGIFICNLGDRAESFLYNVWKECDFGAYVTG